MKTPSVKTLSRIFDKPGDAKLIFMMTRQELINGPAAKRFAECYHAPKTYDLRMYALNECGSFYGHESIESTAGEYAEYLNTGDSYTETVIYWRGNYRIQSIGDFIETMRKRGINFN